MGWPERYTWMRFLQQATTKNTVRRVSLSVGYDNSFFFSSKVPHPVSGPLIPSLNYFLSEIGIRGNNRIRRGLWKERFLRERCVLPYE
jgi:hypothetical protein